ncbi:hypothetical protein [Mesoplasma corruscae]|uniref:Uncharacterized protein n=1 Tax=Mesoplasma corruscae TaxID=216874 RepID=A0A2S5RG89_9MOLU|nr:hypothetical protein [Mesoplasma corruscae]PPE06307.1 hypothetical protein MCORR_v1c06120 [Mesoplasma corruscae]
MNKEVEIDFLEPSLSIIISNLEEIEYELEKSSSINKDFINLIDKFNEVEELSELRNLFDELKKQAPEIKKTISKLEIEDKYETLISLYSATLTSEFLHENEFLFNHIEEVQKLIESKVVNDDYEIFENYKTIIIAKINELYAKALIIFEQQPKQDNEILKILKIAQEETNLNDLREASKLLIGILKIIFKYDDLKSEELLISLVKADVLISLIDLWSEFELEEN